MNFYKEPHRFYCGVDLHTRSMYLCVQDHAGKKKNDKIDSEKIVTLTEASTRASVRNGAGKSCKLWKPMWRHAGAPATRRDGEPRGPDTPKARTSTRSIGRPAGAASPVCVEESTSVAVLRSS